MRWGRSKPSSGENQPPRQGGATAILITGILLCAVFFCRAVDSTHILPVYPEEMAQDAVQTFCEEHAALADALGIGEYFPRDAVQAGAFEDKSEAAYREFIDNQWTFGAYLRDAFRTLIGEALP